jgi:triacylglycerol lipase
MKRMLACLATGWLASCAAPQVVGTPRVTRAVLVHGFAETGSSFKMMQERLAKHGIECFVPRLRPSDGRGGLEGIARRLKQDIDGRFGPDSRIAVISFSMGGIVSRYYLQNLDGAKRCDSLITIASPHNGTRAAWIYPTKGAAQMRPGSKFLAELRLTEHRLGKIPVSSYRTPMDLVILPPTSSIWERAENLEFPVILHPLLLSSDAVITDIERRLMQRPTPRAD